MSPFLLCFRGTALFHLLKQLFIRFSLLFFSHFPSSFIHDGSKRERKKYSRRNLYDKIIEIGEGYSLNDYDSSSREAAIILELHYHLPSIFPFYRRLALPSTLVSICGSRYVPFSSRTELHRRGSRS